MNVFSVALRGSQVGNWKRGSLISDNTVGGNDVNNLVGRPKSNSPVC